MDLNICHLHNIFAGFMNGKSLLLPQTTCRYDIVARFTFHREVSLVEYDAMNLARLNETYHRLAHALESYFLT